MKALTVEEAAKVLNLSPAHVRRHYEALHGIRVGATYRFPHDVYRRVFGVATLTRCEPPQSASIPDPMEHSASDGERAASTRKNAATRPRTKPLPASSKSVDSFATRFPEEAAKLSQSAS